MTNRFCKYFVRCKTSLLHPRSAFLQKRGSTRALSHILRRTTALILNFGIPPPPPPPPHLPTRPKSENRDYCGGNFHPLNKKLPPLNKKFPSLHETFPPLWSNTSQKTPFCWFYHVWSFMSIFCGFCCFIQCFCVHTQFYENSTPRL